MIIQKNQPTFIIFLLFFKKLYPIRMAYKDYYKILGISKSASQSDIKKAYHKLAVKYHPDKNQGNRKAEEKFKEITEAYDVLSNTEKKQKYDTFGRFYKDQPGGGFDPNFDFKDLFGGDGGGFSTISNFFENLFGVNDIGKDTPKDPRFKGGDIRQDLEVSLEEAYHGTDKTIKVEGRSLKIKIKPGVAHNQVLRLRGKGEKGADKDQNGDLLLTLKVLLHPSIERKGNDLHQDVFVDLYTAVLGGKATVYTLKRVISIRLDPGTDSGKVLRLRNMGMPDYKNNQIVGNLYLKIYIKTPNHLTEEEKRLFARLAEMNQDKQN